MEEKVKAVVSMNEDFELKFWVTTKDEWQRMGIKFLQLNTADILHAPTQDKLRTGVTFIQQFNGTDGSVYVHCKAGRTRSATLVACYLMKVSQQMNKWTCFNFSIIPLLANNLQIHCLLITKSYVYLLQRHEWEPKEAVDYIKSKRNHILLRSKQWEAINRFYAENVERSTKQQNINIT